MGQDDKHRTHGSILGDINPKPHAPGNEPLGRDEDVEESMVGGSRHDRSDHAGSRDVTEGVTGGTGTETGGTRNYRQGTGATGTDIGNRPE
ncbi:MAG TPA: hypothetical protein VL309_01225 [Vicinamibacterales bacterium]|jgi:hypothetical protein|nr:hypothetical protein [Vicinamibacterales bacterium]